MSNLLWIRVFDSMRFRLGDVVVVGDSLFRMESNEQGNWLGLRRLWWRSLFHRAKKWW